MTTPKPFREAPRDLAEIQLQQTTLTLPHFTANDAFTIGLSLHTRLSTLYPTTPAVINITLTNSDQLLFHACTGSGTTPDNDVWVARKRNAVKRSGMSSWFLGRKYAGDEGLFASKWGLGQRAGEFAIHGGGVPVRVKGVEGVVGVVVVSGLKQDEDHMAVVEALEEFIERCKDEGAEGEGIKV